MTPNSEREYTLARLATVEQRISELEPFDIIRRLSLEGHRDELQAALEQMTTAEQPLASVLLFFGGTPVAENRGIESTFGASALSQFQDMVSKVSAATDGAIASSGPVPGKLRSRLFVTNVTHGSFGFQLDEIGEPRLFDSNLKDSVERTTRLLAALGEEDENKFNEAVGDVNERVLESMRRFFEMLRSSDATFRVVSGPIDRSYSRPAINLAVDRANTTTIREEDHQIAGVLAGVLPDERRFEFRSETLGVLHGKIDSTLATEQVASLYRAWGDQPAIAVMRVKQVLRRNNVSRQTYVLLGLESPTH